MQFARHLLSTPDRWWTDALPEEKVRFQQVLFPGGLRVRSGPRKLDSGLSEISIVFQAAVPRPVAPKYTTSGVRRPSELCRRRPL